MPLPITRGTSVPLYPFTKIIRTATRVQVFENSSEQRAVVRAPLVDFVLPFDHLDQANLAQVGTLRAAHVSAKGQFDTSLSLALAGITYTNLAFIDDAFEATEYQNNIYRTQLRLRQTIPQALASDANGNVFPSGLGLHPHLPYTRGGMSKTYVVDQESGPRYAFGLYGTGLTGFPVRQMGTFKIQTDLMKDANVAILEKFFLAMNGRYGEFSYTDAEDGTVYTQCGFAQDDLSIEYMQPNVNRVAISIETKNN